MNSDACWCQLVRSHRHFLFHLRSESKNNKSQRILQKASLRAQCCTKNHLAEKKDLNLPRNWWWDGLCLYYVDPGWCHRKQATLINAVDVVIGMMSRLSRTRPEGDASSSFRPSVLSKVKQDVTSRLTTHLLTRVHPWTFNRQHVAINKSLFWV